MTLPAPPDRPPHAAVGDAYLVLQGTHAACVSFRDAFLRSADVENPTDHEQDLLRAMLVFASSGLDAMAKQLIADALPVVIAGHDAARDQLRIFVERRLRTPDSEELLAEALVADDGRAVVVQRLVSELRAGSLQL